MALSKGFPSSNLIGPGVKIAEKDNSFILPDQSTHRAGLVGFASKGPINRPTLVTTVRQLNTVFGYPHPSTGDPYMLYAAEQYLLVGTELFIVRCADTSLTSGEAAQTAGVNIGVAGSAVSIIGNVSVGSGFTFVDDVFFRFKVNGLLASKILVVLADANRVSPDTGLKYSMADLVDTLNEQLVPAIDGIQFTFNNADSSGDPTSTSKLVLNSYFSYGTDASIELVSVTDSLYGPSSVVGMGTGMTAGITTGTETQYPETSIPTPGVYNFSSFTAGSVNIKIVVDGTNNVLIDNVVQSITFTSASHTISNIVSTINTAISDGDIPGGFVASSSSNKLRLTTLHVGQDAKILVKTTSTSAALFGFDGTNGVGTSPSAVTGSGSTYSAALVTGSADSSGIVCFTIYADSPGIEGNQTQVIITNSVSEGTFALDVYNNGNQVEHWAPLTKTQTDRYYVETYVNTVSDYLSVVDNTDTGALPLASSAASPYTLSGGTDGIPADPDDQDDILLGDAVTMSGLQALSDPEQVDIDLICIPGHTATAVATGLIDFAEARGDCFALIDPPFGLNVKEIVQWQNGVHPLNDVRFDSNFAALYFPWVKIRDSFNQIDVWAPPSGSMLAVYARNDIIAAPWSAPAGLNRGGVPGILDTFYIPTAADRDSMQGNRNCVNPIAEFSGQAGFFAWGQKTLQRLPSALDRVNVRRMLLAVEKEISRRARGLLFEAHTALLESEFVSLASDVLINVQHHGGLRAFIVQCDSELNTPDVIDRNELRARIGIQPTKAVEFIYIEFSLHRTGSFAESTSF